jgi:import receptor subunit TOM70
MSSVNPTKVPNTPGLLPVEIPQTGTSSLWDRISTWASEHKGAVYTIAGLTLVVGAGGAIYYLTDNKNAGGPGSAAANKRKTKRDRKKAKERAEKEAADKDVEKAGTWE